MQKHSNPVQPAQLGIIGREHLETCFFSAGCEMESFDYRKVADYDDEGNPLRVETAFGWRGDKAKEGAPTDHRH